MSNNDLIKILIIKHNGLIKIMMIIIIITN